jgi:preprotein translocase subunit SecG
MTFVLTSLYMGACALLIAAVLLQQGKGASMGLLSGAGQSWFGPAASKTLLMKITVGLAAAFLLLAVLLSIAGTRRQAAAPPPAPPANSAPAQ